LSQRRSKLEITLNVLESVKNCFDKPTRIMYASNLSWEPTQRILTGLVEQDFLSEIQVSGDRRSSTRYALTEKGLNVLEYFKDAKELLNINEITK
jgi:predicted transcriptional regulator